jgi:peptide/nickel transport system permease protein
MSRFHPTRLARYLGILLILAALLSDFLSPSAPDGLDLDQCFAPPSRIPFIDADGSFHWHPFTYPMELSDPQERRYREDNGTVVPLQWLYEGYRYRLLGVFPVSVHLLGTVQPGVWHPFGADDLGRDILARCLAGARSSLMVLLLGVVLYFILGVAFGAFSGLCGGWMDVALMRFSEFVLALPVLYLVLGIRAVLPANMPFWQTVMLTAVTIAAVTWPPLARGIRGLILQLRGAGFVEAARGMGASEWHVFRRHLLPALAPVAVAQTVAAAPVFILGELILSYLNVGFQGEGISWGTMLRNLKDPRVFTDFWWNLLPLGFIFITLFCLNSFSSRLRPNEPRPLA